MHCVHSLNGIEVVGCQRLLLHTLFVLIDELTHRMEKRYHILYLGSLAKILPVLADFSYSAYIIADLWKLQRNAINQTHKKDQEIGNSLNMNIFANKYQYNINISSH